MASATKNAGIGKACGRCKLLAKCCSCPDFTGNEAADCPYFADMAG